jgi:hypothetical protein
VFLEYVLGCVIKYSLKDFEVVRLKDDADFVLYTVDFIVVYPNVWFVARR